MLASKAMTMISWQLILVAHKTQFVWSLRDRRFQDHHRTLLVSKLLLEPKWS